MGQRLLTLIVLISPFTILAQRNLSTSRQTSAYTYVYKITPDETWLLTKSNMKKCSEKFLHTLQDSFLTDSQEEPQLSPGNYLLVYAKANTLQTTLKTVGDIRAEFVDNHRHAAIALFNKQAQLIKNAKLTIGNRSVPFDNTTQTYRLIKRKKNNYLKVYVDSTLHVLPLAKQKAGKWKPARDKFKYNEDGYYSYFRDGTRYQRSFRGFMVFSKPMYKPGDTVQLKAFVLNKAGKPVNRPLLLRLSDESFTIDTILTTLYPYRPGGYEYKLVLTDTLDLDLDEQYLVTLEELSSRKYDLEEYDGDLDEDEYAGKRKVLISEKFAYEEYELEKIKFTARTDRSSHHRGNPVALFLKAVDENDLPVADGRVDIIIRPKSVARQFYDTTVFVPDTLWHYQQHLEAVGETKIILPDSIFPAADLSYSIECIFLNSDNEEHNERLNQDFYNNEAEIVFEERRDSVHIYRQQKGKIVPDSAHIAAFDKKSKLLVTRSVQLPVTIRVHPFAATYRVKMKDASKVYQVRKQSDIVACLAQRTKDSITISIDNPGNLFFWYTIFAGQKMIRSGYSDSLYYATRTTTSNHYFVNLQYIHAGKLQQDDYTIPVYNRQLKIEVDQPTQVYPGKTTDINITVKDANGRPVPNADITAFAITKKFANYRPPYVPYFGRRYPPLKRQGTLYAKDQSTYDTALSLTWERWSKEMGLDSIEYFRFLHPKEIYTNTEASHQQVTQIAPFVVLQGAIQPVHQLYIDDIPVFFSQAQQLQQYSFAVKPGIHSLRLRTAQHMIAVDSICADPHKKTFISINADTTKNKRVHLLKMPDTLTGYEQSLWSRYMIMVENNFGKPFAYISNNENFYVLPHSFQQLSLAGPFFYNNSFFSVKNKFTQSFEAEGRYVYNITPGLIKQKQLPFGGYMFPSRLSKVTPAPQFSDFVFTAKDIDSMWRDYLDNRTANEDLFHNAGLNGYGNGRLELNIVFDSADADRFIRNIILFRYDNTDFIRIYKGKTRDLGYLLPGMYRLLILLKGDRYIVKDSIAIRNNGINYYSIHLNKVSLRDTMSSRIGAMINSLDSSPAANYETRQVEVIKEIFNAQYFDVNTLVQTVSGQVKVARQSVPLVGAVIRLKGTTLSVVTDRQGMFSMRVPKQGTLQVSYVGYDPKEIKLSDLSFYEVQLNESVNALNEVIVVGYGTVSHKNFAVGNVTVQNSLYGRVPGIMIRGISSYAGTDSIAAAVFVDEPTEVKTLRRNFKDNAFWQPRLTTNAAGKAAFRITYPDDITNWRTFFYAMASKKQTGFVEQPVRSFKMISANLAYPQFAIVGDTMTILGKSLNYTSDIVVVKRRFLLDSNSVREGTIGFKHAHIDSFLVAVPPVDSLRLTYTIEKQDGYFDGEERTIRVFPAGALETHGYFAALEYDTTVTVSLPLQSGTVKLFAESSLMPVLLDEIDKLHDYEYLCNEQLASKLKALLLKKKIMGYLKKDFQEDKHVKEIIQKLDQNKASEGVWGWWKSTKPSVWISLHVAEALLAAEQQGYTVRLNKQRLIDYCLYQLEQNKDIDQLFALHILQLAGSKADLKPYIDTLEKYHYSLFGRLRLQEVKQLAGLPVSIDSLLSKRRQTVFGNLYWGDEQYRFFDNAIHNTIVMYRMLKRAGGYDLTLRKIRNYFLEKRKDGKWRNTYESSLILETILPDVINEQGTATSSISINGEPPVTTFPYSKELHHVSNFTVAKKGIFPVYFTAYQKSWNNNPEKRSGNFEVTSSFDKKILTAGQPVNLSVKVVVKADAEYVMIEIPIPAGCSYRDKTQSWVNHEVHREYFKNKVSIFCNALPKGSYVFNVALMPRYTGKYHLNPARAEMMYFPVFNGQEAMKKVTIQ